MNREDWKTFKNFVTLGVLPGGTSNGLAKSLLADQAELYGV